MSYTSGRTVKTSKPVPSTIATATAAARKLVKRHLRQVTTATVGSEKVAAADLTVRMGTTITFPEMSRETTRALADAITDLPGYHSMCWNSCSISYLCDI